MRASAAGIATAGVAMAGSFLALPLEMEAMYGFNWDKTELDHARDIDAERYTRRTIHFTSCGDKLEAWFYQPTRATISEMDPQTLLPPVVIMAHGLGSQKDMGLHAYAEQFACDGMAVLVFDYRGFGGSEGLPRHYVSWWRHLQDWQAAVHFVRQGGLGQGMVDTSRIALWGTSYSGGHVLHTAANMPPGLISAVVANEPYLSGTGNALKIVKDRGLLNFGRAVALAFSDQIRGLLGLAPAYIKLVGEGSELSLLRPSEEEMAHITRPTPRRQGGWQNVATARMLLGAMAYHPITEVHKIKCPVLLVAGTTDTICPVEAVKQAQERIGPHARLITRPHNHIELHKKGSEPQYLRPVVEFLQEVLSVKVDYTPAQPLAHEAESQFG